MTGLLVGRSEPGPAPGPAPADAAGPRSRRAPRRSLGVVLLLLTALLLAVAVAAVGVGAVAVPPSTTVRIVAHHLLPGAVDPGTDPLQDQIVWSFRFPRVILAALVGAGLAVVGVVLQTLTRNPLAEPVVFGVSSGAAFGAVLAFWLGLSAGRVGMSGAAFLGAMVSMVAVYLLSRRGGVASVPRMLLAGVALSYLFTAGYSYLLLRTDNYAAAEAVLFWLLGSVAGAEWSSLGLPAAALAVGIVVMMAQARPLNALLAGEETATAQGVAVRRFQAAMLVVTSLLIGVMVAVSGQIAFAGLVIPHVARLVVGADHRRLLGTSALIGAIFLILSDLVARTINAPNELPLTIMTATVGGPFFLWLLRRRHRSAADVLA